MAVQAQTDPYAAYGGSTVASDPYAKYGGASVSTQPIQVHMTDPNGNLALVDQKDALAKLQQGYKIGPPAEQHYGGGELSEQGQQSDFHSTAPVSSLATGFSSGLGIPESQTPVSDLVSNLNPITNAKKAYQSGDVLQALAGPVGSGMIRQGKQYITSGLKDLADSGADSSLIEPGLPPGMMTTEQARQTALARYFKNQKYEDLSPELKLLADAEASRIQREANLFAIKSNVNFPLAARGITKITAGIIPGIGPASYEAGSEMAEGGHTGDVDAILHGAGKGGGTIAGILLGGDKGQQLTESAINKTIRPTLQAAKDLPATVLSKGLGGGQKAMQKTPIPQQTAAGVATNADVAAYAKGNGIDLLPGQATQSRGLKTTQAIGERAIVAPGVLPEVLDQQKANFGNLIDDFKEKVGPGVPDTESAGKNLKSQAEYGRDTLKKSAQADFQDFQSQAGDLPVDLNEVNDKYSGKLADQEEALRNIPSEYARPVRNILSKLADIQGGPDVDPKLLRSFNDAVESYGLNPEQQAALRQKMGLPVEGSSGIVKMSTAQRMRSALLDIARDGSGNIPDRVQSIAAEGAKDIDGAMEAAADKAGVTEQWRSANAKWKQLQETYNDPDHPLYKILQEPDDSKVPSLVLGKGQAGGSPVAIRKLKQAGIDIAPLKREVVQQIADKNFGLTNGGRGFAGYTMPFLQELYDPAELQELQMMGRVGRAIGFEMNPSGTSNVMEGSHQLRDIIHGSLGATVGPLASRITTSKALARAAMGDIQPRSIGEILGSRPSVPEVPPEEPPASSQPAPVTVMQPKAQTAAVAAAPNPVSDRRIDIAGRKRVSEMTPEERAQALLTSDKTGLPNNRAFAEAPKSPAVAMSDADGLKALNDKFGYEAGDALLKAKADALREAGLDAYHDKGDEFLYRGESPETLKAKLENARNILRNKVITAEMKDGRVLQFKGADFSYGAGKDLSESEAALKADKAQREASGQRARGKLRGITQLGPETGQANNSGTTPTNLPGIQGANQQNPVKRSLSDILGNRKPKGKK